MSSGKKEMIISLEEGCRVRIVSTSKRGYYLDTVGRIGEVVRISGSNIAVLVDGMLNDASSIDAYWFKEDELVIIESEDEMMLEKGYMVAIVKFENDFNSDKTYSYALYDPMGTSAIGKLGVTDQDKICRIVDVVSLENLEAYCYHEATKPLKGVCDDTWYKNMVENAAKRKELKAAMDARVKQLEKDAVYKLYAKQDSELAELLAEYKKI